MPFRAELPALGVLVVNDDGAVTLDGCPLSRSEVYDMARVFAEASGLCSRGRRVLRRPTATDRRLDALADFNA